jgi:flagellar basal-body rod protein FlgF
MFENTVYIGLSRQMAMRRQMDVIANNLANMNTTGFKTEQLLFEEYLVDAGNGRKMSFVQDVAVARDMSEGEMRPTGNPLDIALHGDGFLAVETDKGQRFTRSGHLRLDAEGRLVTREGDPVMDVDGRAIEFVAGATQVTITADGTISTPQGPVGRLAVVTFENRQALKPVGGGLYETDQQPEPDEDPQIQQGMIEASNVEPITEMTNMIEVMRAYTSTQQMLDTDSDLRRRAIRDLGKVA